jgi:hypothetical protein
MSLSDKLPRCKNMLDILNNVSKREEDIELPIALAYLDVLKYKDLSVGWIAD